MGGERGTRWRRAGGGGFLAGALSVCMGAAGLAGLSAAAGGCAIVVCGGCDSFSTVSEDRTFTVPHVGGSGVEVRTRNGSVAVQKASGEAVSIHATVRARNA